MKYLLIISALLTFFVSPAEARRHYVQSTHCIETDVIRPTCGMVQPFSGAATVKVVMHKERIVKRHVVHEAVRHPYVDIINKRIVKPVYEQRQLPVAAQIVSHPAGCPSRAFCGCGAAVRIFGHAVRELWLAANWFKFPRVAPAAGMVAVRSHHVYVIEAVLGNGRVIAYDANSGGHQTRIHERSLAGYTVVNPHA